jgi:hypothetical protein
MLVGVEVLHIEVEPLGLVAAVVGPMDQTLLQVHRLLDLLIQAAGAEETQMVVRQAQAAPALSS